ncbi:putative HC-toxin efflux carrier TOXA [Cladophialophora carrionii]|uniref:Putative HC-toxin efflux carrier TOXA n=1 Tax=Cladophialophora carrionii TaxID=86049 RepID=A0A1C1CJL9_9EURO|nr:putative HC-toxin efflux carrier TOXA [Cladophialophora carrionii]
MLETFRDVDARSAMPSTSSVDVVQRDPTASPLASDIATSMSATTVSKEKQESTTGGQGHIDASTSTSNLQFVSIVLALCLAIFLVALDNLIISTAIPTITNTFHSLDDVSWYGSSYLFTTCSFQLVFGKAYTFVSPKYVFIFAIFLFELGSAVCGAAPSSVALILGRTIAGVGSAGVFSGALIITAGLVPLEKRAIYNAVLNSMYGVASIIGPLIGGVLTDNLSWRYGFHSAPCVPVSEQASSTDCRVSSWCFYINLPLGGVSVLVLLFALRSKHTSKNSRTATLTFKQKVAYLDILGTSILIPAIICLLLALQWGGTAYSWSNFRIPLLFALSFTLGVLFIVVQFRQPGPNATLPPHILKQRTMAAASFFTVALAGPFFIFIHSVPIWFQAVRSTSAVRSGVLIIPLCLGVIVMSLASGVGTAQLGYYAPFFYISAVLQSVGAGLMTTWTVATSTATQVGYQLVYGCGVGFAMNLPFVCASTVLAEGDVAIGTALITFLQTLSGAVFLAVSQNVYLNRLASSLSRDLPGLDPNLVLRVGATELKNAVSPGDLDVVKHAYNDALTFMWYISVALACVTLFGAMGIEWRSVKAKKVGEGREADEEGIKPGGEGVKSSEEV